jgi:hypothetical protein
MTAPFHHPEAHFVVRGQDGTFFNTGPKCEHYWEGEWRFSKAAVLLKREADNVIAHHPSMKGELVRVA